MEPEDGARDTPVNPRLALYLDRYLDPFSADVGGALALVSGARRVTLLSRWEPLEWAVLARPVRDLVPGIRYTLSLRRRVGLRDFAGRVPEEPPESSFLVGEGRRDVPAPPDDPAADVRAALHGPAGCGGCHAAGADAAGAGLTFDDPDALAWRPARWIADRRLVVPGHPDRSYLLHKVLPGYPDRVGGEMPSGGGLARRDREALVRALQAWIAVL